MIAQGRWMTGLLAGVLMVGLTGCGQESQRVQNERDALFQQNVEAQKLIDELRRAIDALNMENETLRNDMASQPMVTDAGMLGLGPGIDVIPGAGKITLRVAGDVLFAPGKVELKPAAKQTLKTVADAIQDEHPGRRIRIEGYTDTDPIRKSSWKDNLELSLQRAASVHRFLEEEGLPAELMYAAGFGENKPRATKQESRRVEIVVLIGDEG